jgi:hypothetical protein
MLVKKGKRPVALFVDEAYDLNGHTPLATASTSSRSMVRGRTKASAGRQFRWW